MEKRGDAVIYLSADQISSTSLTTDENGAEISQVRYDPYGAVRWSSGEIPTDKAFTGQRSESFGLMDYKARYYSPDLGHFIQADTIIPGPGNPLAWDRYAYVQNNSVKYTDPTGHWVESALDIAFITYDIHEISSNGLNWENGLSLAADVAGLLLPAVTGGGVVVRALSHADDAVKAINTVDNVIDTANVIDNIMDTANAGENLAGAE